MAGLYINTGERAKYERDMFGENKVTPGSNQHERQTEKWICIANVDFRKNQQMRCHADHHDQQSAHNEKIENNGWNCLYYI